MLQRRLAAGFPRLHDLFAFKCTFCRTCAESILKGRCPNCGGELIRRPIRPVAKLEKFPASRERIFKPQGCAAASSA
jgi:hypothetical protein